jgi:two-component system response regulator CpxR
LVRVKDFFARRVDGGAMKIVTVFSGDYCSADSFLEQLQDRTGYRLVEDDIIVRNAASLSGLTEEEICRCFTSKTSVFNEFTHKKKFAIASLRLALASEIEKQPAIVHGFTGLLLPQNLENLLRVCFIATLPYRLEIGKKQMGLSDDALRKTIETMDYESAAWTKHLFSISDPWSPSLYDMVISTDSKPAEVVVERIMNRIRQKKRGMDSTAGFDKKDFQLAVKIEMALCKAGHDVSIQVQNGNVSLTINKQVLMRSRLESELTSIAESIPGVRTVNTHVDGNAEIEHIYRKHSDEHPSRVLLVDDEQEFVQTLSERLQLRGIGTAVAFDGETALDFVQEDEPEVMIVDLRMPGIDGMELLKRVKSIRPEIEVIILTGHGNENDREQSMKLGAFAYMQKPVDIERLNSFLKRAHEKNI